MRLIKPLSLLPLLSFLCLAVLFTDKAYAGLATYFKDYRATIEWKQGATKSDLRYDTARSPLMPTACIPKPGNDLMMACSTQLGKESKPYYALGIQQIFKRQGFWYFGADFGASVFLLDAKAEEDPEKVLVLQPIQHARAHLYGLNTRAYIQFGITPAAIIPDILISLGGGGHLSTGNLKVDDLREKVNIATGLGYVQFEIVWWRFKDGSLSSYLSTESGGSHKLKGDYGAYENLNVDPAQTSYGVLKLVIPWGI